MNLLNQEQKGSLYALLSGFSYGLLGYFGIKIMDAGLSVFNMLFWRFFVASLLIIVIMCVQTRSERGSRTDMFKMFCCGALLHGTGSIIYFLASKYIGTGLAMVIFFTFPAIVMLINWLIHKSRPTPLYFVAITVILAGLALLVDPSDLKLDLIGIGLGMISAGIYALYIIYSKKTQLPPLTSTLMVSAGTALTCFICALAGSTLTVPTSLSVWANIVSLGVVCTAIPILFLLEALKNISSEKASMLSVLEPVFVLFFGIILLDEAVSTRQILGTIVILTGALITLLSSNKRFQ